MNANLYLQSFGWKEGEALLNGGLKKPILVKHKKDTKGLGHGGNDADMWWEKLFDSQLTNLAVDNSNGLVSFIQNKQNVLQDARRSQSSLYKLFVKGAGLEGTVGKTNLEVSSTGAARPESKEEKERKVWEKQQRKDRKIKEKEQKKKLKAQKKARKAIRAERRRIKAESKLEKERKKIEKKEKREKKKLGKVTKD